MVDLKCPIVLITVIILVGPVIAVFQDGDEFSNNLISDLAPLLSLFGEQVTKQFMSESMGWADHFIFAMVPLGMITAITGAIRVGGPRWLKAIIGRARENIAAAEVELMSSTSHEVGELWNGQQIVRTMGMPPVKDILFLSRGGKYGLLSSIDKALDEEHLVEIDGDKGPVREGGGHRTGNHRTGKGQVEKAKNLGNPTKKLRPLVENPPAPSISLNLHNRVRRTEIRFAAVIAVAIQVGIVLYAGFATYHRKLRYKKDDSSVQGYAFPVMCSGTVITSIGLLICAHVIEDSTTEKRYEALNDPDECNIEIRSLWLQKGERVADQSFESFVIFSKGVREIITTSERKNGWGDSQVKKRKAAIRSQPRSWSNSYNSYPFTGFFATIGTIISLCGFILQFTGLRALHWSVSLAQLGGMLAMAALRAYVRRGLTRRPAVQRLPKGFELDWLATRGTALYANWPKERDSEEPKSPSLTKKREAYENHFWSEGFWSPPWHFTGVDPKIFDEIKSIRIRLWILTGWRSSVFAEARVLASAIDVVLNSLSHSLEKSPKGSMSSWPLSIQSFGNQQVTITATKNQGEEKWKTDVDEIDAILSLWMYDAMKFPKEGSSVGGTTPSAPEDSNRSTQGPGGKNMWLLGLNEAALRRDLKWWSDETLMASLVLAQDKDDMPSPDESRDIQPLKDGCDGPPPDDALPSSRIEIESQRILGFGNIKNPHRQKTGFIINDIGEKPQNEDGSKNQLAVLSSAPLALLGAQKILSAFMKLVAERLTSSIQGTTSVRHADSAELSAGGSSWQSFTLQNAILLKLVQDLQRTGIGSLQEVYLCIIPPLSAEERLPDASAVIEFARQRSEQHELHDQWDRSVDIYIWLFRTAKSFTSSNIFARRATATVMVFFRSALIEEEISVDQDLCMATTNGSTPRRTSRAASKLRQELDDPELEEYSRHVLSLFSLQRKVHSRGRQTPLDWKPFNLQSKDVQRGGRSDDLYHAPTRFTELHSRCFFKTPSDSDSVAISEQIRSPDILGLSPIHYAASPMAIYPSSGDKTYVSVLLDAGADGNVKDLAGWTPLHYNCLWGGAAQFRELMSEGLDIEARARDGTTLLHCAAIGNNPAAARRLIEAGVNIKARDSSRSTPLHWAAYYGNLDVLNVLVQAGGVKERNNDGRTPAHLAALGGHVGVLKVILGEVSSMEDKDRSGFTMLHLAAAKGRTELIEFLVGAEKVTDAQVAGGGPHESSSTSARNADVSAALTRRISDIEAADAKGFRPLHWVANSCSGDSAGHVLVSRGANLHATDEGGRTPLDICAVSGNAKFARYLVKKGACTDGSVEALRHVARARNFEMLKVFFDTQGRPSDHLFHRAIEAGNLESIKFLISQNANMAASDSDPEGATALHIAVSAKDYRENVFQLLADHGAILDAKDKSGQAVVHKAVRMGHYDLVKFLIDKGVDLNSRDQHGNTALHAAVLEVISSKICKLIAESGVDLNLCNEEGRTALHDTARLNKPDLMAILIDIKGVNINVQDVNGMTAMHYIASLTGHGSLHPTITLLTENGADLNLKDKHKSAPIHTAAMRGEHDTMYAMIGKGANPNAKDGHGRTALHIAAQKHDYKMIVNLISLGVNMDLRDNRGRSAIHCTVAHNIAAETISNSVEALTDEGASINARDSYGRTILHLALKTNPKGINKLFDFFITKLKADIRITDKLERTILHYSSLDIENSLVEFFLPRGTDLLNALDVKGYTALHFACFESKPEFVRFLLGKSADFRICVGSWSPLHLTILSSLTGHQKNDCVEIAKTLIAEGMDQSWKDQDGRTALDMAVILEDQDLLRVFQPPGTAAASDESVSEIGDGQAVIDWEDIPSKIDENAGAPADEGFVEKIDEDDGENYDEDDYEGRDKGFGESINQDIGSPTHDNVGALSEDAEEDANGQSTNEQLAATDRQDDKGFSESTDERDLIIGGNIKLGRDEVVSESADKKVIKAGEDKRKLLEAAKEIYAHIRHYRNKEDIDVE